MKKVSRNVLLTPLSFTLMRHARLCSYYAIDVLSRVAPAKWACEHDDDDDENKKKIYMSNALLMTHHNLASLCQLLPY